MAELVWEGKYDKDGNKVAPLRVRLPFQTVETVNESAQERQRTLDLFSSNRPPEWRNQLIWGDKKYMLPALLEEFAGQVNLIYIDPPFDTGADFSFRVDINGEDFTKEPSIIEQKAYRDTWGKGVDSYVQWLYETVILLKELLKPNGSFFLHLDWHVGHRAKLVLDEVFGPDNFINEVIWQRSAPKGLTYNRFPNAHDVIMFYANGSGFVWNKAFGEYKDSHIAKFRYVEEGTGRRYMLDNVQNPNPDRPNLRYEWNGVIKVWRWTKEKMQDMHDAGRLAYSKTGVPYYKRYLDEMPGATITDTWTDIAPINSQAVERLEFPTQKPEALIRRILQTASIEGDLVLDCFVGSGTTPAVAEKLNRRWIACDLSRFAIHTTRKRLLSIPGVKPFVVQNLGKYERQLWQVAEFGEQAEVRILAYRYFILELYHAQPVTGYTWLHGIKAGRMVHVGSVDSPVSPGDVAQIATEFKRAVGTGKDAPVTNGVDVLGWDFAFELN